MNRVQLVGRFISASAIAHPSGNEMLNWSISVGEYDGHRQTMVVPCRLAADIAAAIKACAIEPKDNWMVSIEGRLAMIVPMAASGVPVPMVLAESLYVLAPQNVASKLMPFLNNVDVQRQSAISNVEYYRTRAEKIQAANATLQAEKRALETTTAQLTRQLSDTEHQLRYERIINAAVNPNT